MQLYNPPYYSGESFSVSFWFMTDRPGGKKSNGTYTSTIPVISFCYGSASTEVPPASVSITIKNSNFGGAPTATSLDFENTFDASVNIITAANAPTLLWDNAWHMMTLTYVAGGALRIYVDTTERFYKENNLQFAMPGYANHIIRVFGWSAPVWTDNAGFNAVIRDFRFHKGTLSALHVSQLYAKLY
jgi:hypothetical protein